VIVDRHRADAGLVSPSSSAPGDPAGRAVPRDRAAHGHDHRHLSRREAETLARTVAAPIEEQLSGVEACCTSTPPRRPTATVTITATFEVGTDVDKATFNVNNRVQLAHAAAARRGAPQRRDGAKRSFELPAGGALNLAQGHARHAVPVELRDAERGRRAQAPARVADVIIFGARDYSMRVWLQPDRMARSGRHHRRRRRGAARAERAVRGRAIGAEPAPPGQQLVYTVTAAAAWSSPSSSARSCCAPAAPAACCG
jgi:hypothetical protein